MKGEGDIIRGKHRDRYGWRGISLEREIKNYLVCCVVVEGGYAGLDNIQLCKILILSQKKKSKNKGKW